ncbi:MAG: DUF3078 domain-containing protein [Ignavibacteria bacterium]|nr:DUF3078 domain-containing protein [Ignavibacteria bacterium]
MRRLIGVSIALLVTASASGQEIPSKDSAKTSESPWKHSLVGVATITQVSYKDWAQAGENALSWTLSTDGKSVHTGSASRWTTSYKLAFGQTRLGTQGLRKTDDRIDFESMVNVNPKGFVKPYLAVTLKSQFAMGFRYGKDGSRTAVSKFFDPAYLTQSAGVSIEPIPEVKLRTGGGLREIITSQFNQYADNPSTPEVERTRIEGGVEAVSEVRWPFMENMLLSVKLELFSPFREMQKVVVRSDNTISAKVNKYITVNVNVQLVHEPNVSLHTQMKQTIAVGISYTFL